VKETRPGSGNNPVLMLVNAETTGRTDLAANRSEQRLTDYAALKAELHADIVDRDTINAKRWSRLVRKFGGTSTALAAVAWTRRNRYKIFYSDAENNGLILALLFKLTFTKRPLFLIGHWVTPAKKIRLIKMLRLYKNFTTIFLHSSEQFKRVIDEKLIPANKVKMLPYQVDTEFWKPENAQPQPAGAEPYICAAGLEFRDYATLLEAIKNVPVKVKIGAASNWSKRKVNILSGQLPENVEVKSYNYRELRDLYAGSRFVVVPLVDVDFQAGITGILEAMAMGKSVIVSRSQGQGDTVIDRRKTTRTGSPLPTVGNLKEFFGDYVEDDNIGQTGFYVTPGDVGEMNRAITYLVNNPERADEMGRQGRKMVTSLMRVDQFAQRIRQVIEKETGIQLRTIRPAVKDEEKCEPSSLLS